MTPALLIRLARAITKEIDRDWDDRLEIILTYCAQSPLQKAFPAIRSVDISANQYTYLQRYLKRYYEARSRALVLRPVSTVPDPAVDVVLGAYLGTRNLDEVSRHHRQAMGAENLLGDLLERYIASRLEPKGLI